MTRLLYLMAVLAGGCVHAPDRVILSYQRGQSDDDQKFGVALSCPITYSGDYRPIFEPSR